MGPNGIGTVASFPTSDETPGSGGDAIEMDIVTLVQATTTMGDMHLEDVNTFTVANTVGAVVVGAGFTRSGILRALDGDLAMGGATTTITLDNDETISAFLRGISDPVTAPSPSPISVSRPAPRATCASSVPRM